MKIWFYFIVCLTSVVFFCGGNATNATQLDISAVSSPEPITFEEESVFDEKTKFVDHAPNEDKDISYSLRIPSAWQGDISKAEVGSLKGVLSNRVLSILAHYISEPHPEYARSFFTVEAMELRYEIGIENWFVHHLLINGLSLEKLTIKNRKELESVYIEVRNDTTYIVRTKAIINGAKVVVARYYVPSSKYEVEKVMQAQVVDSFKLKKINDRPIEELQTHAFLSQSYFDYPPSWTLTAPSVKTIKEMKAVLHHGLNEVDIDGQVFIRLTNKVSTPSRHSVLEKFKKNFSVSNYKVGQLIETMQPKHHKDISYAMMQAYDLVPDMSTMIRYELWVTIMESKDYIYLATLITPSREEEYFMWARNIESYKIMLETMRRYNSKKKIEIDEHGYIKKKGDATD